MTRYTLTYSREAIDALASIWLRATDRNAVTIAGDEIERPQIYDPSNKGNDVR